MRELSGTKRFTKVVVKDEPGAGGACHEYYINGAGTVTPEGPFGEYGYVHFQNGPIKENGVNGCHQEDLLIIVADRLEGFQSGEFSCVANGHALQHVYDAIECLRLQTKDRVNRGVEGTNQK